MPTSRTYSPLPPMIPAGDIFWTNPCILREPDPCPHTYGVRVGSCRASATEPCRPTACTGEGSFAVVGIAHRPFRHTHSHPRPRPTTTVWRNLQQHPQCADATTTLHSRFSILNSSFSHTFSAKERDTETGLSYFGARYYSADLSIWLSVDPQASKYPSLSPYVYCADNPVKLVDPNGEEFGWVEDNDGNVFWDNNTNSADEFEQNYKGKTGYSYVSDEENYRSYTLPNGDGKVVLNKWNEGKVTDGYATPEIELEYIPSNPNVTSGWFQTYSSNIPDANSGNDNYILPGADVENRIDFQTVDRTITSVGYWNPADNANVLKDMPRRRFNDGAERSVIWKAESSVLVNGKRSFTISWGFSIDSDRSGYYTSPRIENKPSYFHLNTIQLVK